MAKAKHAEDKTAGAAEGIEFAMKNGAEAIKANFEKAVKSYDTFLGYGKETVEAYMKAANAAGKGAETFQNEIRTFSKTSIEESVAAAKAVLGSKSVHEAFEHQTDFAKSSFDAYVGELTKLSELMVSTTKQTFEPLQGRVAAWVEIVQTARAS